MSNILLSSDEQQIVIFKILNKRLSYRVRIFITLFCLFTGFLIQAFMPDYFIIGCLIMSAGNFLLLVNGYDNRVKLETYDPEARWAKVEPEKLSELKKMQKKMDKWDISATDCSNLLGGSIMLLIIATGGGLIYYGKAINNQFLVITGIDTLILLLPHWLTGLRRISTLVDVGLAKKIMILKRVVADARKYLNNHEIEYYMLLRGAETKIPDDIKFKVELKHQHPDFLGLYGQIVLNNVQGELYPYFYTVLVAKKGYGLKLDVGKKIPAKRLKLLNKYSWITDVSKTIKHQQDVEVLVIRQITTDESGYHTDRTAALNIFLEGLKAAEGNAKIASL